MNTKFRFSICHELRAGSLLRHDSDSLARAMRPRVHTKCIEWACQSEGSLWEVLLNLSGGGVDTLKRYLFSVQASL